MFNSTRRSKSEVGLKREIKLLLIAMLAVCSLTASRETQATEALIGPVTNEVVFHWQWTTQYQFRAECGAHGCLVGMTNTWVDAGHTAVVTAVPDRYYKFDRWLGAPSPSANPLVMSVEEPCAVTALYSVIETEHGIPLTWLDGLYELGTNSSAEGIDHDGDRHTTLQEWLADTIPTNKSSVLAMAGTTVTNGGVLVHWTGGVVASQYLEYVDRLLPTTQQWHTLFTNVPPTAVSTSFYHTGTAGRTLFYRIRAIRPE